jgi:hypothetical protein
MLMEGIRDPEMGLNLGDDAYAREACILQPANCKAGANKA